jgi:hypothetical protein
MQAPVYSDHVVVDNAKRQKDGLDSSTQGARRKTERTETRAIRIFWATFCCFCQWYLDVPNIEAAGYVALSRVEYDANWRFVGDPSVT